MATFDVQIRLLSEVVNPIGGLTYGNVDLRQWTDDTGLTSLGQYDRLNSQLGAVPTFYVIQGTPAQLFAGISFQAVALIAGALVADAGLGGDLFLAASVMEQAIGGFTADVQEVATSAVHNITVHTEGHYCLNLPRDSHGSRLIHFDVEAI